VPSLKARHYFLTCIPSISIVFIKNIIPIRQIGKIMIGGYVLK